MIKILDQGADNFVNIDRDVEKSTTGEASITIIGNVNRVMIGKGVKLPRCIIEIRGNHSDILIGAGANVNGVLRCRSDKATIEIGESTTVLNATITVHEPGAVRIGRDCVIGGEVRMDCSDMFSIIDVATRRRVNPPADIVLEDHVWLGFRAMVWKGVRIGTGAIVSAGASVSQDVAPHCLVDGIPARVLREGVTWNRKLLPLGVDLPLD